MLSDTIGQPMVEFIEANYPRLSIRRSRPPTKQQGIARVIFCRLAASRWRAMGNEKWADYYDGLSHRKSERREQSEPINLRRVFSQAVEEKAA